jgi:hypothetical protein
MIDPNEVLDPNFTDIYSWGGGFACINSPVEIRDSIFAENRAVSSGGGIYFGGSDQTTAFAPTVHNTLVRDNSAGRDGGGISVSWYAEPVVSNCTVVDNVVTGSYGVAYGGGLAGMYDSNTVIVDSIFWGNKSNYFGSEVASAGGYQYGPRPSTVRILNSDIRPDFDPNTDKRNPLDLVFLIDSTASMIYDINAVKLSAADIMTKIARTVPDFRVAVVEYRDFNQAPYGLDTDYPIRVGTGLTNSEDRAIAAINAIQVGGGGDGPESIYYALRQVIDGRVLQGWRSGAVDRVILLMGDAPPHDPEPLTNLTMLDIVQMASQQPGKRIFPVQVRNDRITATYFRNLAGGTGGPMLQVMDANGVVDAIMRGVDLIMMGAPSIHVDPGAQIPGWDAPTQTWDPVTGNISEDPLFIAGYYLSQTASGQLVQSPAVDAGIADANNPLINLADRTTRTDGVGDAGTVDMGYHYSQGLVQYRLTTSVRPDPNDGAIHGTVDPAVAIVYPGFGNDTVDLVATPEKGFKVKRWIGTDDDTSMNWKNKVTVRKDTEVFVEFEPASLYNYTVIVIDRGSGPHGTVEPNSGQAYDGETVPLKAIADPNYEVRQWIGTDDPNSRDPNSTVTIKGRDAQVGVEFGRIGQNVIRLYDQNGILDRRIFLTIQSAIDVAGPNYQVVLSDGVYSGLGNYNLDMTGGEGPNDVRPLIVRSENGPNDCIIDCMSLGRSFVFDSNEDPNYIIRGLTIRNGRADTGGAILIDGASPTIDNCRILTSRANANGGGIYCTNGSPVIQNTWISGNMAGGYGGGFYGENGATAAIINCLIVFNQSTDIGGSIFLRDSDATITLCTIAYNYGLGYYTSTEDDPGADMPKGGVTCRDSNPTITNCIIGRNGIAVRDLTYGRWGDLNGQGDDLYGCSATNSDIENADDGDGNISGDPLWVAGPWGEFYLSQFMGGQRQESPCIDAGEQYVIQNLQDTYNLGQITTNIQSRLDTGYADMGYHYPFYTGKPVQYKLTVSVIGGGRVTLSYYPALMDINDLTDPNMLALVTYVVEPNQPPAVYYFSPGTTIDANALANPGYRLLKWQGTDADASTSRLNTVTVDADKVLVVYFEKKIPRTLNVPSAPYPTIQAAINAAREGDTVVVDTGVYYGGYEAQMLTIDKSITVTSRDPHDPTCVQNTIIDGYLRMNQYTNLGVLFTSNTDENTVFNGFTIRNCGGRTSDGDDGDRDEGHPNGEDGAPMEGAAIIVLAGGRPVIKNCIIQDNVAEGGDGGGGVDADENNNGGRGGWGGWARGAGAYCAPYSGPKFVNCVFTGNEVRGGNGGNGGNQADNGGTGNYGGNWSTAQAYNISAEGLNIELTTGNLWEVWDWDYYTYWLYISQGWMSPTGAGTVATNVVNLIIRDPNAYAELMSKTSYIGDYRWYSGYGGGVYCDYKSDVAFEHCFILNNHAFGGMSGQGGTIGPGGRLWEPLVPFELPSFGAGVYCGEGTKVTFNECTFQNNATSDVNDPNHRLDPYIGYGGGVCAERSASVVFADCNFVDNAADTGGGLYVSDCVATVIDCNIASNVALRGGGFAGVGGTISIAGSDIRNNDAATDPNDPNDDTLLPLGAGIFCWSTNAQILDCNVAGNTSYGSGGGIYLRGENGTLVDNCLIYNNAAAHDGGGLSMTWYTAPVIRNCTFVSNAAPGTVGEPNLTGFGGAIYCGYESHGTIVDTILWENYARLGSELALGAGFSLDRRCGTLDVSYSDIMTGPNDVWVDDGCSKVNGVSSLTYGKGIIHRDPMFVKGPLGDFYLQQQGAGAGQTRNSPCVDAGSGLAGNLGMSRYTTRTDRQPDIGVVDIGYHYRFLEPCRFCDLVFDGIIRFDDFAMFALKWLDQGCNEGNGWCDGADFTFDSEVGAADLAVLADCWLVQDTTPPMPNPPQWETAPHMVDDSTAEMVVKEALDAWGWDVQYYFQCRYGDCHDSDWQDSRVYRDRGLNPGQGFGYRVKARDALGNETKWSDVRFAGKKDTTPPAPAPRIRSVDPNSTTTLIITIAEPSSDENGVEYYFDVNEVSTPDGHDSGWIRTPVYMDIDLEPNTTYCYRVRARDLSSAQNTTPWSDWKCGTTQVPPDLTPPTPNPMAFDPNGLPAEYYGGAGWDDYWVEMAAVPATDDSGGPVQYYFECVQEPGVWPDGFSSGWIDTPQWRPPGPVGRKNQGLRFHVRARDQYGNKTEWSGEVRAEDRPNQPRLGTGTNQPGGGGGGGGGGGPAVGGG